MTALEEHGLMRTSERSALAADTPSNAVVRMSDVMQRVWDRALEQGIPLAVQFDLTYRCNERCIHCYLDHDDHGELSTAEVKGILDQLSVGGDAVPHFQRRRAAPAQGLLRASGVRARAAVRREAQDQRHSSGRARSGAHPRSRRSPGAGEHLLPPGGSARRDYESAGVPRTFDRGDPVSEGSRPARADRERADATERRRLSRRPRSGGVARRRMQHRPDHHAENGRRHVDHFAPNGRAADAPGLHRSVARRRRILCDAGPCDAETLDALPCSAGHTACYISPYGDIYPCVQFPLPSGNLRQQRFEEIWYDSRTASRGAGNSDARPSDLFLLQPRVELHALSGAGLHGRQHARALVGGLRKIDPSCQRGAGGRRDPHAAPNRGGHL